jgi:hypothetical protein
MFKLLQLSVTITFDRTTIPALTLASLMYSVLTALNIATSFCLDAGCAAKFVCAPL